MARTTIISILQENTQKYKQRFNPSYQDLLSSAVNELNESANLQIQIIKDLLSDSDYKNIKDEYDRANNEYNSALKKIDKLESTLGVHYEEN
ncbi:hypothetical protein [Bacillus sp. FJAT-49736]|uniref:hypothetical protein n=1 Tax=Bacillus sp. FJAT-49736 TaxID=2833582 RepID=UPI001BCA50CB|nr:hypothetical protein [Bacillus sp. FJAT-49736]MBS4174252.1 hypothetical protein [Bacillus sp. FJAT-49736]